MPEPINTDAILAPTENITDWNRDNRTRLLNAQGQLQAAQVVLQSALDVVRVAIGECERIDAETDTLKSAIAALNPPESH